MTGRIPPTFTHQVIGDHIAVHERLKKADTQANRRELVRATFSAVEGLLWQLKQGIFEDATVLERISIHEQSALREETYSVDQRGKVNAQPRFLPITVSIRLVVDIVQRFRPKYELDFSHVGWQCLRNAIEVRNRIMHPKNLDELTVTDDDLRNCDRGFAWFLAFVIEALQEHVEHNKGEYKRRNIRAAIALPRTRPKIDG